MVILTGTPPPLDRANVAQGEVARRVRQDAINRTDPNLTCFDWGRPDGPMPDVDDESLAYEYNPALGGRLNIEEVRRERKMMSPRSSPRSATAGGATRRVGDHRGRVRPRRPRAGPGGPARDLVGPEGRRRDAGRRRRAARRVRRRGGSRAKLVASARGHRGRAHPDRSTALREAHQGRCRARDPDQPEVGLGCTTFQDMVRNDRSHTSGRSSSTTPSATRSPATSATPSTGTAATGRWTSPRWSPAPQPPSGGSSRWPQPKPPPPPPRRAKKAPADDIQRWASDLRTRRGSDVTAAPAEKPPAARQRGRRATPTTRPAPPGWWNDLTHEKTPELALAELDRRLRPMASRTPRSPRCSAR
jgi:hypothetical protein